MNELNAQVHVLEQQKNVCDSVSEVEDQREGEGERATELTCESISYRHRATRSLHRVVGARATALFGSWVLV